jgi:hypothetical protein
MTTDSDPADVSAAQFQYVCRLTEAMTTALTEARGMANRADFRPPFAELLLHVRELHDLMNETLATFDPVKAEPLIMLSNQMRSATNALLSKVAN